MTAFPRFPLQFSISTYSTLWVLRFRSVAFLLKIYVTSRGCNIVLKRWKVLNGPNRYLIWHFAWFEKKKHILQSEKHRHRTNLVEFIAIKGTNRSWHWNTDIDECLGAKVPCYNGEICVDRVNSYTCDCKDGYVGKYCGERTVALLLYLQARCMCWIFVYDTRVELWIILDP